MGDADALAVLVAAGESSAPRAPALAARWYAAALHLLPEAARTEAERIGLLVALATALGGAGQLEESRSVLCEVLDRLPAGDPGRTAIVAYCAGVEHLLGRHRDANARLAEAHRDVADGASADAVALEIELAAGAGYENRYEDMAAMGGAGARRRRPRSATARWRWPPPGRSRSRATSSACRAAAAIERAAAGLDALDDAELAGRLDIGLWVGWTEAVLERHEQADRPLPARDRRLARDRAGRRAAVHDDRAGLVARADGPPRGGRRGAHGGDRRRAAGARTSSSRSASAWPASSPPPAASTTARCAPGRRACGWRAPPIRA